MLTHGGSERSARRGSVGATMNADGQTKHATTAVGYASSSEAVVRFGLGPAPRVEKLEIHWPSGANATRRVCGPGVDGHSACADQVT